jgi:DNA-binding FadR family transcriptional regulator
VGQPTRTDDVTRTLREEVLRARYRPGDRLPSERELAARFGTTRDVARVALKKLEQLGLATVQPGGARVQPLHEASLDVIPHLLELDTPPDPDLVDQVLEVLGALLAANVRMALERAQPERLERAEHLAEEMSQTGLPPDERHRLLHEFAQAMLDANDNVVMHIARRGLDSELVGPLENVRAIVGPVAFDEIAPRAVELRRALGRRDGLAAYEATYQIWILLRRGVRQALEAAHAERPVERPRVAGEAL